jgi:peptide/nickel transport system substrate-binding protein
MKKIPYLIASLVIVAVLVITACGNGNGNGNGYIPGEEPVYGGILKVAVPSGGVTGGDPGQDPRLDGMADGMFERMLRRDITKTVGDAITLAGFEGHLLDDWEIVSDTHFILTLRDDVTFQDLPPVNGRGMTADDIVYCADRFLGLGINYETPSVWLMMNGRLSDIRDLIVSFNATGTYTVEITLSEPYLDALQILLGAIQIYPRELQDTYGEEAMNDWTQLVGSGGMFLDDWVTDSKISYVRNPDYWLYDWDYPANRLPYPDAAEILIIPDDVMRMAALRTGQVAYMAVEDQEMVGNLRDNPGNLNEFMYVQDSPAFIIDMNTEHSVPLDDIRVRKALNMAVNREEIVEFFYEGAANPTPFGQLGDIPGYNYAYADWPQGLKDEYSYNPTAAEALLLDAGYSGNLTIDILHPSVSDGTLLLLMKDYFTAIGVTSNIEEITQPSFSERIAAQEAYGLTWYYYSRFDLNPAGFVSAWHYNGAGAGWMHDQPTTTYDDMVDAMIAASTTEEQRALIQQCDQYALENHFAIPTPLRGSFVFWQPWFFGFDYEGWAVIGGAGPRVWIDEG